MTLDSTTSTEWVKSEGHAVAGRSPGRLVMGGASRRLTCRCSRWT